MQEVSGIHVYMYTSRFLGTVYLKMAVKARKVSGPFKREGTGMEINNSPMDRKRVLVFRLKNAQE